MDFSEYKDLALRTAKTGEDMLEHATFGIVGEVGELMDMFKKEIFHGKQLEAEAVTEEIGDVFWYTNLLGHSENLASPNSSVVRHHSKLDTLLRLGACAGLLSDITRRVVVDGDQSVRANIAPIAEELNQCLIDLCNSIGLLVGDVLDVNVAKLKARYPEGFSQDKANNRDVEAEGKAVKTRKK